MRYPSHLTNSEWVAIYGTDKKRPGIMKASMSSTPGLKTANTRNKMEGLRQSRLPELNSNRHSRNLTQ